MRLRFDKGSFVDDLKGIIEDARKNTPSLVVVPTEREVKTFERTYKDSLDGEFVWVCSFADYYSGQWMMAAPRPKHIYILRTDDIMRNLSADGDIEYMTVVGKKRYFKKEEIKDEI